MKRLLIDTDTASDDAVALMLALRRPEARVEAITTVAGNVPVGRATTNALVTIDVAAAYHPLVYVGAAAPLRGELRTAQNVHGSNGMGEVALPEPSRAPEPGEAADALVRIIRRYPGELTLVTLGPLTNVALALRRDPGIARLLREAYVMGGTSDHLGNVTPAAEFNVWADPEAAREVFLAGLPLTMVGWDVSRKYAVLDDPTAQRLRALGTPQAEFAVEVNRTLREYTRSTTQIAGIDLPDPVTVALALEPGLLLESVEAWVDVEIRGELTRGATVVDYLGLLGKRPNARVCLRTDEDGFVKMLFELLG